MSREPDSNREIPDTLAYAYGSEPGTFTGTHTTKPKHEPFNPDKLRQAISQVDIPDPVQYLRDRSPQRVDIRPSDYLRAISQPRDFRVAMPIVSITDSGGRGAHALVRANTTTKEELKEYIDRELLPLTVYGADHNALTEYRLTRL